MEVPVGNITGLCPSAFSGTSGGMFARAVAALVAAHCATTDVKWPVDNAHEILGDGGISSFDYIVVGAGTAGSILASRLSNIKPRKSVLLIEAGDDPGFESEVPALFFVNLNEPAEINWRYEPTPNGNSCLGSKNNNCIWSKGKAMGGSSSINAMMYTRGHPNDYEYWKTLGNSQWGYDNISKYFQIIEDKFTPKFDAKTENPLYNVFKDAWKELGFTSVTTDDNEARIGTKRTKLFISNGKRLNAAKIYLKESNNLKIMKNTVVQKVIIDAETKRALGVEILHKSGVVMQIAAMKEVILSAGSIATPQLLMLSGIGVKDQLSRMGIECALDLPVGQNLQDHVIFSLYLKTNINTVITTKMFTSFLLEYMFEKTGPISNLGILEYFGFINSKNDNSTHPDIQYFHTFFTKNDTYILKDVLNGQNFEDDIINNILELNKATSLLSISPSLLHPKSKGEIQLSDSNPKSKPIIKANYFNDIQDLIILKKAIEFVHKLEKTESFKSLGIKLVDIGIPGCSKFPYNTDKYWDCYIRFMSTTIYHPVGTAKMGSNGDSVVDQDLMVHGMQNLRVVDASIMPSLTSGNTMAPTMMIAEKAADIIKRDNRHKDEL